MHKKVFAQFCYHTRTLQKDKKSSKNANKIKILLQKLAPSFDVLIPFQLIWMTSKVDFSKDNKLMHSLGILTSIQIHELHWNIFTELLKKISKNDCHEKNHQFFGCFCNLINYTLRIRLIESYKYIIWENCLNIRYKEQA